MLPSNWVNWLFSYFFFEGSKSSYHRLQCSPRCSQLSGLLGPSFWPRRRAVVEAARRWPRRWPFLVACGLVWSPAVFLVAFISSHRSAVTREETQKHRREKKEERFPKIRGWECCDACWDWLRIRDHARLPRMAFLGARRHGRFSGGFSSWTVTSLSEFEIHKQTVVSD